MCGILAALGITGDVEANRRDILKLSKLLRHRGPDANAIYQAPDGRAFIAFERLMIVDPTDTGRCVIIYCCKSNGSPALCFGVLITQDNILFYNAANLSKSRLLRETSLGHCTYKMLYLKCL